MTTTTDRRQGVNSSIAIKAPVAAATTANITLSGEQTIDGVAIVSDDRVLVKDQTDASENGIYKASTSAWTRAPDMDGSYDLTEGTLINVEAAGTVNGGLLFECTTTGPITIGTTNLAFSSSALIPGIVSNANAVAMTIDSNEDISYTGAAQYAAGEGIVFNGDAIDPINTLDDYEEGTWTPVLSDGTNNATASSAVGFYTKVGRAVHIKCQIIISSLGSVSGNVRITGLPFAAESTSGSQTAINVGFANNFSITAGYSVDGYIGDGDSYIRLYLWDATTGTSNLQESEVTASGQMMLSGTYNV